MNCFGLRFGRPVWFRRGLSAVKLGPTKAGQPNTEAAHIHALDPGHFALTCYSSPFFLSPVNKIVLLSMIPYHAE